MKTVKLKKTELLEKIRKNRNNHRAEFDKAIVVYRERAIAELEESIKLAKRNDKIRRFISLPEPEEHTDDYDRVIGMLEMSVDDIIELSQHEFAQYVLNQWGWMESFARNTSSYVASA